MHVILRIIICLCNYGFAKSSFTDFKNHTLKRKLIMLGLVIKYQKKKNHKPYGFISGYDGEKYFFSGKTLKTEVHEGDEVRFKDCVNERGFFARDVQLLEKEDNGDI